jgi:hypothetical protein
VQGIELIGTVESIQQGNEGITSIRNLDGQIDLKLAEALTGATFEEKYPETKKEREETDRKKREGSRQGKQFVSNTETAKKASKAVRAAKKYKG